MPADLEILFEDNHLLAINKPAGLPTMGVAADEPSLVVLAKKYIKSRYAKPGNVYLGIVSRLDTGTTGVVLLARTSKAAARLSEQFRGRQVRKTYWALASGRVEPAEAECTDWLLKDEARQRMAIVGPRTAGAQQARLAYRTLRTVGRGTLLEIDLFTGRKHQIRLQLASRGYPLWGERKYGQGLPFVGLGLHARRLVFRHPVRDESIELVAPLPASWRRMGISG